jgi:hypothetical protein
MMPDPTGSLDDAGRTELLRLLVPVSDALAAALADPPRVSPHDWLGPASSACAMVEAELRSRLLTARTEVEHALAAVRSAG